MEECNGCKIALDWHGDVPFTNIPHTDVYYCDKCLHGNQDGQSQQDSEQEKIL